MIIDDLNFKENPYTVLSVNTHADDKAILTAFGSSAQTPREEQAYKLIKDHSSRLRYALLRPLPVEDEVLFHNETKKTPVYRSPGFWYDTITTLNKIAQK